MQTGLTRRNFVHGAAGVSAALATRGRILGANDRINTAVVGLGTRGAYLLQMALHRAGEKNDVAVVALCDVYQARLSRAAKKPRMPSNTRIIRSFLTAKTSTQ